MHKILVAVDGSEHSERAVRYLIALIQDGGLLGGRAVSRNKCNSQLIFLSMLITKLGIPASETSLPLGV